MSLKLPIFFLTAILGASVLGGLVLGGSLLKERWEPRITYVDALPVDPGKTEFRLGGGGYVNERCEYYYLIYASWGARRFRVVIERFSGGLRVLDGDQRVEATPYLLQEGNLPEERCIWLSFGVVMPNETGTHELELSIRLSGWLFSKEYRWIYTFKVEPFVPKPPPEACLTVTLDKETYRQGEIMNITIENVSNETQWFGNAAYDVCFERFNGECGEFYDSVPGAEVITCLKPGETGQVTWKLGGHTDRPFPPGQYRVGVHGVYAEFEVVEDRLGEADLEAIIIEFLKTTDVPNGGWDGTVEIGEIYDHKPGGKVVVVNYTTVNGGHPGFFLEAIEHHTA